MHLELVVRSSSTVYFILLLVELVNHIDAVQTTANSLMIDTHWDRFRIQDVCSNENRNLRLYLDFGDRGWVRGYTMDESNASKVSTTPVFIFTYTHYGFASIIHSLYMTGTATASKTTAQHRHKFCDVIMHFGAGDMSIVPVQGYCKV